jgi:N-methylhydantoinase A
MDEAEHQALGELMKVGIDVGGTFTDLFSFSDSSSPVVTSKVSSTPKDFTEGVVQAIDAADIAVADIDVLVHGSTIATNAVIQRRFPRTAFLTTAGFRDLVQIGRYHRPKLYDPYQHKPDPIIKRRDIFEVSERMSSRGEITQPLNREQIDTLAEELRARGIESVAVAYLNSYANPTHERETARLLLDSLPDLDIALSSDVSPKIGALERFVTTMLSASLRPVVGGYVSRLERRLKERGFAGTLWFVLSNGGVMLAHDLRTRPEQTFVSGPAAGVQGALHVAEQLGQRSVITLDMGGTSCDVTIVEDGRPFISTSYEIEFDMPLATPVIDIRTIGAGGGSIAWVDPGGGLQVGPQSAGAEPGPACYDRGGTEPTVTDANLVLGYLDDQRFLGGQMTLNRQAAETAVEMLAKRMQLDVLHAAEGIRRIVNENMAAAIREVSTDRGRDPRDFALIPFGGAGPLHAIALAESIGIPRVVVPPEPEVLSAFGATVLDVRIDAELTRYTEDILAAVHDLESAYQDLADQGKKSLNAQGIPDDQIRTERVAELRYIGQTYEVPVRAPVDLTSSGAAETLIADFHAEHESVYGVSDPDAPVAIVNLRVAVSADMEKPPALAAFVPETDSGEIQTRQVFVQGQGMVTFRVYWRADLNPGTSIVGPAVIEQRGSTFVVPDGWSVQVDESLSLIAERSCP